VCFALQNDGTTALFVASQYGHLGAVRSLLGAGASVNQARVSFTCLICLRSELGVIWLEGLEVAADVGSVGSCMSFASAVLSVHSRETGSRQWTSLATLGTGK
jgi:hypothetical protein